MIQRETTPCSYSANDSTTSMFEFEASERQRGGLADVGQLYDVTKHERFHGHGQKCGRRTGPSPKFRNDIGLF